MPLSTLAANKFAEGCSSPEATFEKPKCEGELGFFKKDKKF